MDPDSNIIKKVSPDAKTTVKAREMKTFPIMRPVSALKTFLACISDITVFHYFGD